MADFCGEDRFRIAAMRRARNLWRKFAPRHRHGFTGKHSPKQVGKESGEHRTFAVERHDEIRRSVAVAFSRRYIAISAVLRSHYHNRRFRNINDSSQACGMFGNSAVALEIAIDHKNVATGWFAS